MKIRLLILASVLLSHCTTTSQAAGDIEGVVVMVGSAPNARPIVEPNGPKSQLEICPGPQQDYLRKFGGTIIKGSGEWGQNSITKERCFNLKSFQVAQLIKGRPAYTGTLTKSKDGNLTLDTAEGKHLTLEQPSKGVSELAGKRVIMDLLPSTKTGGPSNESLWKVVSYMEYPVQ